MVVYMHFKDSSGHKFNENLIIWIYYLVYLICISNIGIDLNYQENDIRNLKICSVLLCVCVCMK